MNFNPWISVERRASSPDHAINVKAIKWYRSSDVSLMKAAYAKFRVIADGCTDV